MRETMRLVISCTMMVILSLSASAQDVSIQLGNPEIGLNPVFYHNGDGSE